MKKVIITGSNGFVGSNLANKLLDMKFDVICLVRNESDTMLLDPNQNIKFVDYEDQKQMTALFSDRDIVIHSAALTRTVHWSDFEIANIRFTEKILQLFNESPSAKQFIFISSHAASGPSSSITPKKEEDDCNPVSLYGKSKFEAENIIRSKAEKKWTIIRPVSVFGAGDKDFLNYFKLIKHHISLLIGKDERYISLIHIDDLIDLIIKTIGNEKADNQVFFASDGIAYSWEDFVSNLERAMDSFSVTLKIPEWLLYQLAKLFKFLSKFNHQTPLLNEEKVREMTQRYWLASNQKAVDLLDFSPKNDLMEKLRITFSWYKQKGWI